MFYVELKYIQLLLYAYGLDHRILNWRCRKSVR